MFTMDPRTCTHTFWLFVYLPRPPDRRLLEATAWTRFTFSLWKTAKTAVPFPPPRAVRWGLAGSPTERRNLFPLLESGPALGFA